MSYLPAGIGPYGCTRYEINPDGGTERSFFACRVFFGRSFPACLSGIPHAGIRGFGPYRPVGTFGPTRGGLRRCRRSIRPPDAALRLGRLCGRGLVHRRIWIIFALRRRGADARPREGFPKRRARGVSSVRGEIPGFRRRTAGATAFPNRKPNRIRYDELFV